MDPSASMAAPPADLMAIAVLAVLDGGATAIEVARRLALLGSANQPGETAAVLRRLAGLGLVRAAGGDGESARFVLTPLGQRRVHGILSVPADAVSEMEELERLRTDLLSTISHELRTPLTAVRTSVGLLLDPAFPPDPGAREQLLKTIAQSAERMQRFVTDVLDIARFRAGSVRLQRRRFDARALAREAAAVVAPLIQARRQRLDLALPAVPVWVYGDHRRLEQALLNLLSNAQKFSPDGGVVRVSVAPRGEEVTWTVSDEGPGIGAEEQGRLFERFFTSVGDAAGRETGAGLGLPIALAIARAHGGTIEVDSTPGRGSTFVLRVPAHGPDETDEP